MTLTVLTGLLAVGCTDQIITNAARTSLASFLTNIASQTINATINR